jgi:hypothetical protein
MISFGIGFLCGQIEGRNFEKEHGGCNYEQETSHLEQINLTIEPGKLGAIKVGNNNSQ